MYSIFDVNISTTRQLPLYSSLNIPEEKKPLYYNTAFNIFTSYLTIRDEEKKTFLTIFTVSNIEIKLTLTPQ